jgi:hypothetical protein
MHTRFLAQGAVCLTDATIVGALNCTGGHFENAGGIALSVARSHIGRDVILGSGFKAAGTIDFTAATVDGTLDTEGATYDQLITEGASIAQ